MKARIEARLKKLTDNPVPSDAKFLGRNQGEKVFRYRIGDYRALYSIDESKHVILIADIDKRSRVYN